ncbi:MAG: tRNA (adenosine(37)-N6)-threonylcarbamoyltransferase complex ATPase subunit type 1 TsaE [Sphaerochaetaceae bacterium]
MLEAKRFITASETESALVGTQIAATLQSGAVVSLRGPLGSGKSVIARAIARALGITEPIVSPTFTLIQEYQGTLPLYHMDLYRLQGIDEFEGIGAEELLDSDAIVLIEWSEIIDAILPKHTLFVSLEITGANQRIITVEGGLP